MQSPSRARSSPFQGVCCFRKCRWEQALLVGRTTYNRAVIQLPNQCSAQACELASPTRVTEGYSYRPSCGQCGEPKPSVEVGYVCMFGGVWVRIEARKVSWVQSAEG